jgi:hypothetical protein
MVADLPEIGQHCFASAIAPGTALHKVARLEMEGSMILNDRELPMRADQILVPPQGFVLCRCHLDRRGCCRHYQASGAEPAHWSWSRRCRDGPWDRLPPAFRLIHLEARDCQCAEWDATEE